MRRVVLAGLLVIGTVLSAITAGGVGSATGVERGTDASAGLPLGFTDGVPVGRGDEPTSTASTQPAADTAAAPTPRYFGRGPYEALRAAVTATARPCSLSDDGLTALALAPVFGESSAATTPSTAPSPMTLSRYNEWTGSYPPPLGSATDTNRNANYGLYAFRDPTTSYRRAYWNPGIGIWQYDSAGVGAPFTTIEAMDVGVVGADVAAGMIGRYCAAPDGSTPAQRRAKAWAPWGACVGCEDRYQDLTGTDPTFSALHLVDGISATGGASARTCTVPSSAEPVTCWYVRPELDAIQGATAWATLAPRDGGDPTVAPTPISAAFYVIDRGATEERHWLRADTGYTTDISASRVIGENARPRGAEPDSGLTWSASSGLCDLTAGRGACRPVPPAGITSTNLSVGGTFRPVALDADGDGRGDVLWYAPGAAPDYLWRGQGSGAFTSSRLSISGTFDVVLAGDIDGAPGDDVLWYAPKTGTTYLWRGSPSGTFTSSVFHHRANLQPLLVDLDGDGTKEVFWYGGAAGTEEVWHVGPSSFVGEVVARYQVSGTYTPIVADVDGNGHDDIFWYAPGPAADHLWRFGDSGAFTSSDRSVSGRYTPLVGDFDGDGRDDIVWYAAGPTADRVWFGGAGGAFTDQAISVGGTYQPVVVDLAGDGRDDLIWYATGAAADSWWRWAGGRTRTATPITLPGAQQAVVGGYADGGADGIVWYGPNGILDAVWWR